MVALFKTDYADSPASFVRQAKDFITTYSTSWSLVDTLSGTADYQDHVFTATSSGTTSYGASLGTPFCIRLLGYDAYVNLFGYDDCTTLSGEVIAYSGEIYDSIYSRVYTPVTEFKYWLFVDETDIKFVFRDLSNNYYYHGYAGLIESVYYLEHDPVPILILGTNASTNHWEDGNSPVMMTSSGTKGSYKVYISSSINYGETTRVASSVGGIKPILYYDANITEGEVRGYPNGVFKIASSKAGAGVEYNVWPSLVLF
jgi:hypothetical protein